MLVAGSYAMACTNFIVGKKASADGSVFVTYNADSFGAFMPLYHYPAAKHQPGEMLKIYEWDTNKYLGEIAEAAETWNVIGNSNHLAARCCPATRAVVRSLFVLSRQLSADG